MKVSEDIIFGEFSHIGSRNAQEDGTLIIPDFNNFLKAAAAGSRNTVDLIPKRSLVAILDGHGGDACMKFVRQKLAARIAILYVEKRKSWEQILSEAVADLEDEWIHYNLKRHDMSGTTLSICLIEDKMLYTACVGDSPCYLMRKSSKKPETLVAVHRPDAIEEKTRIEKAGGYIMQRSIKIQPGCFLPAKTHKGPHRAYPGGLAVSRTIGDLHCKMPVYGGIEGAVISKPTVHTMEIPDDALFLVLCTDGLSDNLRKGPTKLQTKMSKRFNEGYKNAINGTWTKESVKMKRIANFVAENCVWYGIAQCDDPANQDNITAVVACFLNGLGKQSLDGPATAAA